MSDPLEGAYERAADENKFTREIHFKNEAFTIGILQAVSGASLVAGLAQLDTLLRLAPTDAVLIFLSAGTVSLGSAVLAAFWKHEYKMWASPDIPDTFDSVEDYIGGVRWSAGDLQRSSSVRQ
jgi:hypothetical protein